MTEKTKANLDQAMAWINRALMAVCAYFLINLANDVRDIKNAQTQMLVNDATYISRIESNTEQIKKLGERVDRNTEFRIRQED